MTRRLLRAGALLIAVAALLDPAVTSARRVRPEIALITTDHAADRALLDRVATHLARSFNIVRGPFTGAAAVVAVGREVPPAAAGFAAPAFAVVPDTTGPEVAIARITGPDRVDVEARTVITPLVRTAGARGRTLTVTLRRGGIAIDRQTHHVTGDAETRAFALTVVPTRAGVLPLEIAAGIDGVQAVSAHLAVEVRETRWAVLFFDRRPSWMSTFVRRALAGDPRFTITSRVATSRGVSLDQGRPGTGPAMMPSLALFDAVVIGAPEDLTASEVAALDDFLRRRGGAVTLLLDQPSTGRPFADWAARTPWIGRDQAAPIVLRPVAGDTGELHASEFFGPRVLPPGAVLLARPPASDTSVAAPDPVVWRSPAGAGRLIVSGALDAWRFRDANAAAFDRFWRTTAAAAAGATPPAMDVRFDRSLLPPGGRTVLRAVFRDAALSAVPRADAPADVTATLRLPSGPSLVTMWPDGAPGHFAGTITAPEHPGSVPVEVAGSGMTGRATLLVANEAALPAPDDRDALGAWAASRGGRIVAESRLNDLAAALDRALSPPSHLITWHPMRSSWWILPFALALGAEWWMRRRAGQR